MTGRKRYAPVPLTTLAALAFVLAAPAPARSGLIYDNGQVAFSANAAGFEMTRDIDADNFAFSGTHTITSVRFWDFELLNHAGFQGNVSWFIYTDGGGIPGTLLASGTAAPTSRVDLGFVPSNVSAELYRTDFSVGSVVLGPGTYWLGLHNGPLTSTDGNTGMFWAGVDPNFQAVKPPPYRSFDLTTGGPWGANFQLDMAFQLSGDDVTTAAPEPSSLALGVMAAVGLAAARWRRRRPAAS